MSTRPPEDQGSELTDAETEREMIAWYKELTHPERTTLHPALEGVERAVAKTLEHLICELCRQKGTAILEDDELAAKLGLTFADQGEHGIALLAVGEEEKDGVR